jgi:NhaP-type Na+/H+ or K+/H+ antiporter
MRGSKRIDAGRAHGGDVVLKWRWQRLMFIAGLAGCVVLAFALALLRPWS